MSNNWDISMEAAKHATASGELSKAEAHLLTAVREAGSFDKTDFRVCYTHQRLADVMLLLGKKSDAVVHLEIGLKLRTNALGPHHDSVVAAETELAKLCYELKKYKQAEELASDALRIYELTHGSESVFVGTTLLNLATMYHIEKRYDEAEEAYKRSLSVRTKVLGANHPDTGAVLKNYARLMKETHREAEAEHMDACATGVITGSWKPVTFEENEQLHPSERCKFCGSELGETVKCEKCGTMVGATN